MSKMDEAKAALNELLENARVGNIIPIRLPGQIEEIHALMLEAEDEHHEEIEKYKNLPGGDAGEFILENAEFIKTAVHDLKNPLASIKGYGDLLNNPAMAGELTEMQMQLLDVIRTNTQRMEVLLQDVSIMNKIRSGILMLNPKMDAFKNVAMMVEKTVGPLAEKLNRQLEFDIPSGLPYLNLDSDHLAEALTKLIENGLKYSHEGEGRVRVSAEGDGSTLVIHVEDNGVGMKPDELERLGETFFRADNDLVRSYKGSGLGIPIAYSLIEILKGEVAVESEPDQGTRFTIRMPAMA